MSSFVRRAVSGGRAGGGQVSTGVAELDKILGGGIPVGKIVVVIEDKETTHHLMFLRYFMAQGLSHKQPILFGSPLASPRAFLATLPTPVQSRRTSDTGGGDLRIAWRYHKYEEEEEAVRNEANAATACSFDLRTLSSSSGHDGVECVSFEGTKVELLLKRSKDFISSLSPSSLARIAMHSLCTPQSSCCSEWEWLCYVLQLKALISMSNAVALITVPTPLFTSSLSKQWQHLADILLSVEALDGTSRCSFTSCLTAAWCLVAEEQNRAFADAVGLVHVRKLCSPKTQVPFVPQSTSYALKIVKKRELILEPLHSAPVQGAGAAACASSTNY